MSQENVEIVRRDVAARNAREWAGLAEIWHPEIELEVTAGAGTYRGIDQITRLFDSFSDLFSEYRVEAKDTFLFCSDGLTEMVSEETIATILQEVNDPQVACERLVGEANKAGGKDNITVLVAAFPAE